MAANQLVTGVGSGNSFRSGEHSVSNSARAISASGFDASKVAKVERTIVSVDLPARNLQLDLAEIYTPLPGTAVYLNVSGPPVVLGALGDSQAFGRATLTVPDQLIVSGTDALRFGIALTAHDITARALLLDLVGAYVSPTALNIGLYWGPIVAVGSAGSQTIFGSTSIRAAHRVSPAPMAALALGTSLIAHAERGWNVELNLLEPLNNAPPIRLDFSPDRRPVVVSVGATTEWGTPAVANAADAINVTGGIASCQVSFATMVSYDVAARALRLDLVGEYSSPSAAAIQLSFGGADKAAEPDGWDALRVGEPALANGARVISLDAGIAPQANQVGSPRVANRGDPLWLTGFVATSYGTAHIWNWHQYSRPTGFATQLFGTAYFQGGVKYVATSGVATATFGVANIINTTADQTANPQGIAAPAFPAPRVSPRFLRPVGLFAVAWGSPIIQRLSLIHI